jgi:hypothetical protein
MGGYAYAGDSPVSNADPSGLECAPGAASNGNCNDQPVQEQNNSGSGDSGGDYWGSTGSYGGPGLAPGTSIPPPSVQRGYQAAYRSYAAKTGKTGAQLEIGALAGYCDSSTGFTLCGYDLSYKLWAD